ncbi:MAG: flagellar hook-length control protein FliK [Bacillota bacterium]
MNAEAVATPLEATALNLFQASAGRSPVAGSGTGDFLLTLMALMALQDGAGSIQGENSGGDLFAQVFSLLDCSSLPGCWPVDVAGLAAGDKINDSNDQSPGQSSPESLPVAWWLPVLQDNPVAGQLAQVLPVILGSQAPLPDQPQAVIAGNQHGQGQVQLMAGQVNVNFNLPVAENAGFKPEAAEPPLRPVTGLDGMAVHRKENDHPAMPVKVTVTGLDTGLARSGPHGSHLADPPPGGDQVNRWQPQAVPAGSQKSYAGAVVNEGRIVKPGPVTGGETAVFSTGAVQVDQAVEQSTGPVLVPDGPAGPEGRVLQRDPGAGNYNTDDAGQWNRPGGVAEGQKTVSTDSGGDKPGLESNGKSPGGAGEVLAQGNKNSREEVISTVTTHLSNITARKFPEVIVPHLVNSLKHMTPDPGRVTVIRLKLEPENMGEIRIKLAYAKGELTAHFYTASGLVKDAVECSLPQLKEALAQYNVNLGEAAAFVGHEQQSQKGANFGGYGYGRGTGSLNGGVPSEYHVETAGSIYTGSGHGSLDLLV